MNARWNRVVELLFTEVWWQYAPNDGQYFSSAYHWFNIAEGLAWLSLSGLVLLRFLKHRNSLHECIYSVTFLAFGITDFVEAWQQSSCLIWLKLGVLLFLFRIRRFVISHWYPDARIY